MSRSAVSAAMATIAREELGIRTLDTRGGVGVDFHDLHVGRIERPLTRAYREGGVAAVNHIFTIHKEGDQS